MQIRIPKKLILMIVVLFFGIFTISIFGNKGNPENDSYTPSNESAATIKVKAGYFPQEIVLPANKENVLRFVTENTYDCSASLLISKLRIEKFLPPTGNTDITIPAQSSGTEIIAGCSMGMYNFKLKFL